MWARGRALRAMANTLPGSVVFQHGPRSSRRIALTFDDGPGPLTSAYLEALERASARASFFLIGEKCPGHEREIAAATERGHDVAGHGWSHTAFPELTRRAIEDELARTQAHLPPSRGGTRMVRPPFGRMTPRSLLASFQAGYTSAMWSFDPLDWQATSANEVVRAVDPAKLEAGDILLLHEERRATLEALPTIIARLRDAGFELVSVSQLLAT